MSKVISVYINGTDEPSDFDTWDPLAARASRLRTSLANILNELTVKDSNNITKCIDGCAINNPYSRDLGGIFTWHLEKQVNDLAKEIKEHLTDEKTILNLYGFSRGGAGVYLLAKKLKDIEPTQLEINILAFEPVPGNFIYNVYFDKFFGLNMTLSSMISDLSDSKNLKLVESLYTNEPLPDILCHAPILPSFASTCESKVSIVPGCHKNAALFWVKYTNNKYCIEPYNTESAIAFHFAVSFLKKCGTVFDYTNFELDWRLQESTQLQGLYNIYCANKEIRSTTRHMHFSNSITTSSQKPFLNTDEQFKKIGIVDPSDCSLSIKNSKPIPSYLNGQKSAASIVYPALIFSAAVYGLANTQESKNLFRLSNTFQ